jgi:hypothetical protein
MLMLSVYFNAAARRVLKMGWRVTVRTERTPGKPPSRFLMVNGFKIARRGYPGTKEAGTWVSIEPGWEAKDVEGGEQISVKYTNPMTGQVITFPE